MLPVPACLAIVFVIGLLLGAVANWAAYVFAYQPRLISPWSRVGDAAPTRTWSDRLPVVGWWLLRREATLHGARFWIRPLLVEVAMGAGLAALYWWEVVQQGLIFGQLTALPGAPPVLGPVSASFWALHCTFVAHALLITWMVAASLVDIDEKIIPDALTVTGTLLALILAAAAPMSLLPQVAVRDRLQQIPGSEELVAPGILVEPGVGVFHEPTTVNAPNAWPPRLLAERSWQGLLTGVACFLFWRVALTTRIWRGRRGWLRGLQVLTARVLREMSSPSELILCGVALVGIAAVWRWGGAAWLGLATALIGMVGGGALVWATRVVGSLALRVEAMGFGDVTLMMMVGAFLGWQAGIIIFFVAPFAGLAAGLIQLALRRDNVIPYGPYLCLGALLVMVRWADFWNARPMGIQEIFGAGWLIPAMLAFVMVLLGAMLVLVRVVKTVIFGVEPGIQED